MRYVPELFARNRAWADRMRSEHPEFFGRLREGQAPSYLWIGCSDSRVPANAIVELPPGEMFVHRNVANLAPMNDLSAQSVLQFAVGALRVGHIIVCGHYQCGGVRAAMDGNVASPLAEWLEPIRRVHHDHADELATLPSVDDRWARLCELNVAAQVEAICATEPVQDAWAEGQSLVVHGWMFDLGDGLLRDLDVSRAGSL